MDKVEYFWYQPSIVEFRHEAAQLRTLLPLRRYYHMRRYLRAYYLTDDVPEKGVGWKVVRATEEINRIFATTMSCPGRDISIDEGMAVACSTRNPIYRDLLGHEVVVGVREDEADVVRHRLWQTEPGSAGDGTRRKKTGYCRQCPNTKVINGITHNVIRRTNYYCSICKVHFHLQCFAKWHEEKGHHFVPSKQSEF